MRGSFWITRIFYKKVPDTKFLSRKFWNSGTFKIPNLLQQKWKMTFALPSQWAVMISPARMTAKENIRQASSSWLEHWTDWLHDQTHPVHSEESGTQGCLQRSSKAADHSVCCPLAVVPTWNDWKPGGNRVKEGTATAEEEKNVFTSPDWPTRAAWGGRGISSLNQPMW